MNLRTLIALGSAVALSAACTAQAQTDMDPATLAEPADQPPQNLYPDDYQPSWSDSDLALIAEQLTGSWASTAEIESGQTNDGAPAMTKLLINIAPVPVEGMDDTLYVEGARADTPWAPYRQAIFQLYRYKGKVRLRTYELAVGEISSGAYTSMWAIPEYFPTLRADQLIATLDLDLEPTATGFTGATPYPYPTGAGGAVEMTSSITLDGDTLTTADRGYDAQGEVVSGASSDGTYTFERAESPVRVTKRDDGMAILDIGNPGDEMVVQEGDEMHVRYSGYLTDGFRFDSSEIRNVPFVFKYPPAGGAIVGWGIGMDGLHLNGHRKLVIPGELGFGQRGNPRSNIPPMARLIFDVDLVHLIRPEPEAADDTGLED